MEKKYETQLVMRFGRMQRADVLQEIAFAEILADGRGERLAFKIALCNLLDLERKRQRYERVFIPLDGQDDDGPEDCLLTYPFEVVWDEMEWRDIVSGLPYPARKLAQFARQEAEAFENVPAGIWGRMQLNELRRRIKRRFLAWDRFNSMRSYYRARQALVAALHRRRNHG